MISTTTTAASAQTVPGDASSRRGEYLKWAFSLACTVAVLALSRGIGLSGPGSWYFALTVLAVCLWGFNVLPEGLVAVMLPIGYILTGVGKPGQILAPWTQPMGWMILGGLMTGLMLTHTGLARRIALWALHVTGSSFRRLLWGILLAGFIITPLMPTSTGKCILLGIICIGLCDAMGFAPKSREASIVLMAGYLAVAGPRLGFYTGSGEVTLNMQMAATAGMHVTWFDYFVHNFAPCLVYSIVGILVLRLVMRPRSTVDAKAWVEKQYAELGPVSRKEKKAIVLFVLLAVLMMTDKYHGINIGWIMMMVGFAGFLPGLDLVDGKKFSSLNLTAVLFIVGCMSIGSGAQATGMDKRVVEAVLPLLSGGSQLGATVMSFLAGLVINFLLTPVAAVSTLTVPIVEIGKALGYDPHSMVYSFMMGLDQYVLPYEFAPFLYMFSLGYIGFSDLFKVFSVRMAVSLILLVVVF